MYTTHISLILPLGEREGKIYLPSLREIYVSIRLHTLIYILIEGYESTRLILLDFLRISILRGVRALKNIKETVALLFSQNCAYTEYNCCYFP